MAKETVRVGDPPAEPGLPTIKGILTPEQQPVFETEMRELSAGKRTDPLRQDIMQTLEVTDPDVYNQILLDVRDARKNKKVGGTQPESPVETEGATIEKPAAQPLRTMPGETQPRAVYTAPSSLTQPVFPFEQAADQVMATIDRNTQNVFNLWQVAKDSWEHGDLWEGFKTAVSNVFEAPGQLTRGAIGAVVDRDLDQLGQPRSSQQLLGLTDAEVQTQPTPNDFLGAVSPLYAINLAMDSENEDLWRTGWTDILTDPWTYAGLGLPKATRATFAAGRRLFGASAATASQASADALKLITPLKDGGFSYEAGARVLVPGTPGQDRGIGVVQSISVDKNGNQALRVKFLHGTEGTFSNLETLPSTHLIDEELVRRVYEGKTIQSPSDLLAKYDAAVERTVGKPISHEETLTKANQALGEGKMTVETLEQVTPETPVHQDVIREAILVTDEAYIGMMQWGHQWLKTLDEKDLARFGQYWAAYLRALPGRLGLKATSGRTLAEEQKDAVAKNMQTIAEEGGEASLAQIATRVLKLGNKRDVQNFMEEGQKFSWKDTFINDYMLSGMVTAAAPGVLAATQSFLIWNGVYKTFAGMMPGRSTSPLEGPLYLYGVATAWADVLTRSGGLTRFYKDMIERGTRDKFGEKFAMRPLNVFPRTEGLTLPQKTAKWMAFPFTLLGRLPIQGIDVFARFQIMEGMKRSQAIRKAWDEATTTFVGSRAGFPQISKPVEFSKRLNEFYKIELRNPKKADILRAHQEGDFVTMTRKMEGQYTGPLQQLGQTPMGKVVSPFWSVTMQSGAAIAEQLPIGLLSKGIRDEFAAGGPQAKEAMGKLFAGTMLASWAAWGWGSRLWTSDMDKSYVTGDTLINPRQDDFNKDGVFQGRAINFYDAKTGKTTSVSCQAIDPICGLLNFAGNVSQYATYVKEDDPTLQEASAFVITSMMNVLSNPLTRKDLESLHDALFGEGSNVERLQQWSERKITALAPFSAASKMIQRNAHEYQVYQKGLLARMKQSLPIGKTDEPLWVNGRGQFVRNIPGGHQDLLTRTLLDYINPTQVRTTDEAYRFVQDDPVLGEFTKQRYVPQSPNDRLGSVKLSAPIYMRRRLIFGNLQINGQTYWDALTELVTKSPLYKKGIAGVSLDTIPQSQAAGGDLYGLRKHLIEEVATRYRKATDLKLRQEFPHIQELNLLRERYGKDAEIPEELLDRIQAMKRRDEEIARFNMQVPEWRETLKVPPGYGDKPLPKNSMFGDISFSSAQPKQPSGTLRVR